MVLLKIVRKTSLQKYTTHIFGATLFRGNMMLAEYRLAFCGKDRKNALDYYLVNLETY